MFPRQQNLQPIGQLHGTADPDSGLRGCIEQLFHALIDQQPFSLVEREIANPLFLLRGQPLIGRDQAVDVPREKGLPRVDHEPVIVGQVFSALPGGIEIEDGQLALEGGFAERAFG